MHKKLTLGFLIIITLLVSFSSAEAYIALDINDEKINHSIHTYLDMNISIIHDVHLSEDIVLKIYIDDEKAAVIDLEEYLQNQQNYTLKTHIFNYNVVAEGWNNWTDYPSQTFTYTVSARGWCGSDLGASDECKTACSCDGDCPAYPCEWHIEYPQLQAEVSGYDGLKFIKDGLSLIAPPQDGWIEEWSVSVIDNTNVEATMRAACGGEEYPPGITRDKTGWNVVGRKINTFCTKQGAGAVCNIGPFNEESLQEGYRKYGGPSVQGITGGGVYMIDDNGNMIYQRPGVEISSWNGSEGKIVFNVYDADRTYVIFYLPPDGSEFNESHRMCAYTDYSVKNSSEWKVYQEVSGNQVSYDKEYIRTLTDDYINNLPYPDCPIPDQSECNRTIDMLYVVKTYDPDNAVSLNFDPKTKTVTARVTKIIFAQNYTENVSLYRYRISLSSLDLNSSHVLKAELWNGSVKLLESSSEFWVCEDQDEDGYCETSGICSDNDPSQYPGAKEICDGKDNDCDGEVDEDFRDPAKVLSGELPALLGEECYNWEGSACAGTWVCSQDGLNLTCNAPRLPGEQPEICANNIDDDCDGEIDETFESDGKTPACVINESCTPGETKPCGSNIGRCKEGYRICINNEWSECRDYVGPVEEVCNRIDDDCNGIVDDVNGGESVEETHCRCYNNGIPSAEICNDIDDDCDGKIDDGISCCTEGETRTCGINIGVCKSGIQRCINGSWGKCEGAVLPSEEICYDNLDNDCDGSVDENCNPDITCRNGIQDLNENGIDCGPYCPNKCFNFFGLVLIALGTLILIILFIMIQIKKI